MNVKTDADWPSLWRRPSEPWPQYRASDKKITPDRRYPRVSADTAATDQFATWVAHQTTGPAATIGAMLAASGFWARPRHGRVAFDDVVAHLHDAALCSIDEWAALQAAWRTYWRAGCPSTPDAHGAPTGAATMAGDDTGRPAPARESAPPGTDAVG